MFEVKRVDVHTINITRYLPFADILDHQTSAATSRHKGRFCVALK
jgi:hypothetical protein